VDVGGQGHLSSRALPLLRLAEELPMPDYEIHPDAEPGPVDITDGWIGDRRAIVITLPRNVQYKLTLHTSNRDESLFVHGPALGVRVAEGGMRLMGDNVTAAPGVEDTEHFKLGGGFTHHCAFGKIVEPMPPELRRK
jgi:hypothetical protein